MAATKSGRRGIGILDGAPARHVGERQENLLRRRRAGIAGAKPGRILELRAPGRQRARVPLRAGEGDGAADARVSLRIGVQRQEKVGARGARAADPLVEGDEVVPLPRQNDPIVAAGG